MRSLMWHTSEHRFPDVDVDPPDDMNSSSAPGGRRANNSPFGYLARPVNPRDVHWLRQNARILEDRWLATAGAAGHRHCGIPFIDPDASSLPKLSCYDTADTHSLVVDSTARRGKNSSRKRILILVQYGRVFLLGYGCALHLRCRHYSDHHPSR